MFCRRSILTIVLLGLGAWVGLRWLEHHFTDKPYALIEERLYVGGAATIPPPGTGAVVNLCHREDPYEVDVSLWEPLDGVKAPTLAWLQRVVEFIDSQRRDGTTIYVHCLAGMNRSGMVVTAYLMYEHGWHRDEALAYVRSRRPQVQPNPTMMRLLAEWERELAERHKQ